jgi:hypothetical protein
MSLASSLHQNVIFLFSLFFCANPEFDPLYLSKLILYYCVMLFLHLSLTQGFQTIFVNLSIFLLSSYDFLFLFQVDFIIILFYFHNLSSGFVFTYQSFWIIWKVFLNTLQLSLSFKLTSFYLTLVIIFIFFSIIN